MIHKKIAGLLLGTSALVGCANMALAQQLGYQPGIDLDTLGGTWVSAGARAVSADGAVIVGFANLASGDGHAAAWIGGTPTDLGGFPGGISATAGAVSADGTVIVGNAYPASGSGHAVS